MAARIVAGAGLGEDELPPPQPDIISAAAVSRKAALNAVRNADDLPERRVKRPISRRLANATLAEVRNGVAGSDEWNGQRLRGDRSCVGLR